MVTRLEVVREGDTLGTQRGELFAAFLQEAVVVGHWVAAQRSVTGIEREF
jgi:hypothetical protein